MINAYKFRLYPSNVYELRFKESGTKCHDEAKASDRNWKSMNSSIGGCHIKQL